jgi:hypothetical protein
MECGFSGQITAFQRRDAKAQRRRENQFNQKAKKKFSAPLRLKRKIVLC